MNRAILRRAGRLFGRVTRDDIADAASAALIFATPVMLSWIIAGLGLVETTAVPLGAR